MGGGGGGGGGGGRRGRETENIKVSVCDLISLYSSSIFMALISHGTPQTTENLYIHVHAHVLLFSHHIPAMKTHTYFGVQSDILL